MKVYVTDHVHSRVVSKAFAQGCGGQVVPPLRLLDGPATCYGILRGCGDIIKQCQWVGRDFYHIDHGYMRRGHYEGYYRVTRNAFQCDGTGGFAPDRFEALGIEPKPWQRDGDHVVVIPLTGAFGKFLNIDPDEWTNSVVAEIAAHTDRPVIVKRKDGTPLRSVLTGAHCMVTHSSNAAVDALIEGLPVVTLGNSACAPVATALEEIESLRYPDRDPWLWALAYNQFTLDEMRSGEAMEILHTTAVDRLRRLA